MEQKFYVVKTDTWNGLKVLVSEHFTLGSAQAEIYKLYHQFGAQARKLDAEWRSFEFVNFGGYICEYAVSLRNPEAR